MIETVTFRLLAEAIGASVFNVDKVATEFDSEKVNGISIDTRTLRKGDFYLALKGDRVDGHDYVDLAIKNGCRALIVNRFLANHNVPQFVVEDTSKALADAAKLNRNEFKGPLIALTGSSGKTSTKNILNAILGTKAQTRATEGNFNNEIGVPLTLLSISASDKYAVVEMGARAVGDIAYLVSIASPDAAILLNAGHAHIDIFGSYENIIKTKGEIYQGLDKGGIAVVNFDDLAADIWLKGLNNQEVITFSINDSKADLYVSNLVSTAQGSSFTLNYQGCRIDLDIPLPGEHSVKNCLAASAAALKLGFTLEDLVAPLASLASTEGRLNPIKLGGLNVIDDSYNANPASVKAAVDVLSMQDGMRVAVLAEMAELGAYAKELHMDVADYVARSPIEKAFFLGKFAEDMAELSGDKGVACHSKENVVDELQALAESDMNKQSITVLIKGSRSTRMEEVCEMLERRAA